MRMGNLLGAETVRRDVMSRARPRLGVRHLTVVPANAESASEGESESETKTETEESDADDRAAQE